MSKIFLGICIALLLVASPILVSAVSEDGYQSEINVENVIGEIQGCQGNGFESVVIDAQGHTVQDCPAR